MGKHVKLSADQVFQIEEWHRQRVALGSQKQMAVRMGCSEPRIQQIVGRLRRGDGASKK